MEIRRILTYPKDAAGDHRLKPQFGSALQEFRAFGAGVEPHATDARRRDILDDLQAYIRRNIEGGLIGSLGQVAHRRIRLEALYLIRAGIHGVDCVPLTQVGPDRFIAIFAAVRGGSDDCNASGHFIAPLFLGLLQPLPGGAGSLYRRSGILC